MKDKTITMSLEEYRIYTAMIKNEIVCVQHGDMTFKYKDKEGFILELREDISLLNGKLAHTETMLDVFKGMTVTQFKKWVKYKILIN